MKEGTKYDNVKPNDLNLYDVWEIKNKGDK